MQCAECSGLAFRGTTNGAALAVNTDVTGFFKAEPNFGLARGGAKAVVLAGGLGTDRCPVLNTYSSLLFPFCDGQSLLVHLLRQLRAHGIREVAVSLSADAGGSDRLIKALSDVPPSEMTVHWQIDGGNRGAAGALKELEGFLSSETTLVLHPGVWLGDFDLEAMWIEHNNSGATVTLLLESAAMGLWENLDRVGLDSDGRVQRYSNIHESLEKRSFLRPAGLYLMQPEVLEFVEPGRYVDFHEQLLDWLNEDGFPVRGYIPERPIKRFGNAYQYVNLNRELMLQWWSELDWAKMSPADVHAGVRIGSGSEVAESAVIVGPVTIGQKCVIEEHARIIGPALICDDTTIGKGSLVRDSIVWRECRIGAGAIVEHSLVTERCEIKPGGRLLGALVGAGGSSIGNLVRNIEPGDYGSISDRGNLFNASATSRSDSKVLYLAIKRALDVAVPIMALPVLAPVLILTAIAVKLDSPGPVIFQQVRCGKNGREFSLYKFRTMVVNAEELYEKYMAQNEARGPMLKIDRDPRTTRIGHFLRKTSLDELPQLWNVLRGDMTLIGPRPLAMREMVWCPRWRDMRLRVKPGLSGMWQVSSREEFSFDGWIKHDITYVQQQSLWLDLKILLKTLKVIWRRPNKA